MKGEVLDERSAIHRLREGDISGMEFLVRTYQGEALRAANLITRDMALAEDVVQDGFIQAWERIETFDPGRPFGPWFRRCVVNLALKAVKRQGRHVLLHEDPGAEAGSVRVSGNHPDTGVPAEWFEPTPWSALPSRTLDGEPILLGIDLVNTSEPKLGVINPDTLEVVAEWDVRSGGLEWARVSGWSYPPQN